MTTTINQAAAQLAACHGLHQHCAMRALQARRAATDAHGRSIPIHEPAAAFWAGHEFGTRLNLAGASARFQGVVTGKPAANEALFFA